MDAVDRHLVPGRQQRHQVDHRVELLAVRLHFLEIADHLDQRVAFRVVLGIRIARKGDVARRVDVSVEVDNVVVRNVGPVLGVARPALQLAQVSPRIVAGLERLALVVERDVVDRVRPHLGRVGRGAAPRLATVTICCSTAGQRLRRAKVVQPCKEKGG